MVTHCFLSPSLKTGIEMGYVKTAYSLTGTESLSISATK